MPFTGPDHVPYGTRDLSLYAPPRSRMEPDIFRGVLSARRDTAVLLIVVASILLLGCGSGDTSMPASSSSNPAPPASPPPPSASSSFLLAARVSSSTVWSGVQSVFQAGDFALVPVNTTVASAIAVALQITADKPGIHIVFFDRTGGLNSVNTMDAYLTQNPLPPEIDYVAYDFEPTYQPEFTFDEPTALPLFAQAKAIAATHGKKVYPTPFNPFRSEAQPNPWNMGLVAQVSADALDVQLQQILTQGLPTYQADTLRVRDGVRAVTPDLKLFLQLSFALNTPDEVLAAGQWLQSTPGISGIFVIYDTSNPSLLINLMQSLLMQSLRP